MKVGGSEGRGAGNSYDDSGKGKRGLGGQEATTTKSISGY